MKRLLATPAAALVLLAGCGSGPDSDGLSVVASFYPLEYVAERIVGDRADVTSLAASGTPHDAELSVSQTAEIVDSDVLVYLSSFQPAVDDAVTQADDAEVVDAAAAAELVALDGGDEHSHADGEDEEHSGEAVDPHFWLDPTRLAAVTGDVADALSTADPENAETYADHAAALEEELLALDQEITEGLQDCLRDTVVVSHDAFGYFGERYGLELHPIAGLSPDSEPSPQHLAELQELIKAQGVTTVFSETLASPAMAQTLSTDLGLETGVLDPIEGLGDVTAEEDYFSLMRQNLAALQQANDCG